MPNYDSVLKQVKYAVKTTGDAMFCSTIGSTDSPDYTADKVEANTQCVAVSPLATERVA